MLALCVPGGARRPAQRSVAGRLVFVLLALAAVVPRGVRADDPVPEFEIPEYETSTMRTIFTLDAGNYLANIVGDHFEAAVRELPIPDFSGDFKTEVGTIKYSISNVAVTQAVIGTPHFTTDPSAQVISAEMLGNTLEISFDYSFEQMSWPYASAADIGSLSVTDLGVQASAHIYRDPENAWPMLEMTEVLVALNEFSIHLNGGALAWVINAFSDIFEENITKAISDLFTEVAMAVADALAGDLGDTGMALCAGSICIDGRYGADPLISDNYISLLQGGTVFYGPDQSAYEAPSEFPTIPAIVGDSWVQAIFSTGHIETYFETLQFSGALDPITAAPSVYGAPLDAASIAAAFPELSAKYPGMGAQVTWKLDRCSDITTYPVCMLFTFLGTLTISPVDPATNAPVEDSIVLEVLLDTSATLNWKGAHDLPMSEPVTQNQNRLTWRTEFDYVELTELSSSVGTLGLGAAAEDWFAAVFERILGPDFFNRVLEANPIYGPRVMNCHCIDRRFTYQSGYVSLGYNIEQCE